MATTLTQTAAETFDWKRWPETEEFVDGQIATALEGNAFTAVLADRMARETSTRFKDWVDHLVIGEAPGLSRKLAALGYARQAILYGPCSQLIATPGRLFPSIAVATE